MQANPDNFKCNCNNNVLNGHLSLLIINFTHENIKNTPILCAFFNSKCILRSQDNRHMFFSLNVI